MVSWDIKVKFFGMSPHIKELQQLAEKEGFSNIEKIIRNRDGTHTLTVNERGTQQKTFKTQKMK